MKKLFVLLTVISAAICINTQPAFCIYDAGALNTQYTRDLRVHEAVTRTKNKSAIVSTKTAPKTQDEVTASNIKSITFVNNSSIPSNLLQDVVADKINQPMTTENISAIRKDIMKYYQDRGFFSAVAMVVSEDSQTGELVIDVKEGGRNSIQIQD